MDTKVQYVKYVQHVALQINQGNVNVCVATPNFPGTKGES